ncbi:hypothetical protein GF345_01190, partial [Candidatus Woesearchaeota archaeon]|nr:hypothetical protein [Candidatus Woesearchaeota archaeon]
MAHQTPAMHHLHKRKRIYKGHQKYPHPERFKRVMDKVVYAAGVATPIMTLPQVFKIFMEKSADAVSPFTWGSYFLISLIFGIYGILHREIPLI